MRRVADGADWNKTHRPPTPARQRKPGELLFEFVRASDGAPMFCELRFNGDRTAGKRNFWSVAKSLSTMGGFVTRALVILVG